MSILISITGDLGSGKSTVCDIIAKNLNLKKYYMGGIQRAIAEKYNMDTLTLNIYAETHPEIDDEIDDNLRNLANSTDDIIVDSRMAWHFLPTSYKVYLTVEAEIAAARIMDDNSTGGRKESYSDIDDACKKIKERKISENNRYLTKYGVKCGDIFNYDLVLDTSKLSPEEVADLIIESYNKSRGTA